MDSEYINQTVDPPPDVTGLQVEGMGNEPVFYGKDCKFVWNRVSATAGADRTPVGNEIFGAVEGTDDPYFKDFYLEIWVDNKKVRQEVVTDNWYIYTYEKNVEDNGTAKASFTIKVWARNNYNQLSCSPAVLTVSNPAPDPAQNFTCDFYGKDLILTWDKSNEEDLAEHPYKLVITSSGGVKTVYPHGTKYVYDYDENIADNGTPDPSPVFSLYVVDAFGQVSAVSQVSADNTPPSPPTGLSATSGMKTVILSWNANPEPDFDHYEIYYNTSSNSGTSVKIGETKATVFSWDEGTPGQTYYFWLKAVDSFGNKSDFSVGVSCQVGWVVGDYIADATIDLAKHVTGLLPDANLAQITDPDKLADAIITATKIATGAVTHDKISAGAIYGDVIAAEAIATNHLAVGAVVADKIASNAVTTDKIHAGAVTTDKIQAGAITGDKIAAGTITGDKIYGNTLSAIKADLGTISAGRIQNSLGTLYFDLNSSKLYCSVSGGIQINSTDGLHLTGGGSTILEYHSGDAFEGIKWHNVDENNYISIGVDDDDVNFTNMRLACSGTRSKGLRWVITGHEIDFNVYGFVYSTVAKVVRDGFVLVAPTGEPAPAEDGMIAYADGVNWNPGSGEGFYGYYNGAWHKLG